MEAGRLRSRPRAQVGVMSDRRELLGECLGRERGVRHAGVDRALGHAVELRRLRSLYQADTAVLLDGLQAERAVRAHAREDDPDRVAAELLRERTEEEVDRQPRVRLHEVQRLAQQCDVRPGGRQVDLVGLDDDTVGDLEHLHPRRTCEELDQHALVLRRSVLDDHEPHAVELDGAEERRERLEPTGGCSDADDGENAQRLYLCTGSCAVSDRQIIRHWLRAFGSVVHRVRALQRVHVRRAPSGCKTRPAVFPAI